MKPIVFHPEAVQEYLAALRYYTEIQPTLGLRFDQEIQRLVNEIKLDPARFFHFEPPTQRALAIGFPYSVVYLNQPDRIWIVAVIHAKRRPGYWHNRF